MKILEQEITKNISLPDSNIEILKKYFANCFNKQGDLDFEKFKSEISKNKINISKESYSLNWLGKSYARLLAVDNATTLLKEDESFNKKEQNKNSQNLLIKGDNLEVLKHLSNAYHEKIKMIYIDPPYNTGSDGFVYQDDRKFTVDELMNLAGLDEEKAKRILDFVDSKSNSHSAWLTFMYPRLYIARQLLKDDGVIFVSIDDNEVAQLRLLMDEIFGEENFVGLIVVETANGVFGTRASGLNSTLVKTKDYVFVYANSNSARIFQPLYMSTNERFDTHFSIMLDDNLNKSSFLEFIKNNDSINQYFKKYGIKVSLKNISKIMNIDNEFNDLIIHKLAGKIFQDVDFSLNIPEEIEEKINKGKIVRYKDYIVFRTNNGNGKVRQLISFKQTLRNTDEYKSEYRRSVAIGDLWEGFDNDMKNVLDEVTVPFDSPKPIRLIKQLLKFCKVSDNDIVLDFFAGSGTTAHAVMQLNAEDGGNRKFILVQLPEKIDPKNKKTKVAYDFVKNELGVDEPTIFEICKERLIRASNKIKNEIDVKIKEKQEEINNLKSELKSDDEKIKALESEIKNLKSQDLGFKIFETMPIWEDYNFEFDELTEQTTLFDESKLTDDDLKALLITWKTYDQIPLTENLQEIDLDGYTAYYADNKLYLLDKGFRTKNLKNLLKKIDNNKDFIPTSIIAFGYNFESKSLREIGENIKTYNNHKELDNIKFKIKYLYERI